MPMKPPQYKAKQPRKPKQAARPSAARRGYNGDWQKARAEYLYTHRCCVGTLANGSRCKAKATVVDHVQPHQGDKGLFWRRSNWQAMCGSCHSRKTCTTDGGFGNRQQRRQT